GFELRQLLVAEISDVIRAEARTELVEFDRQRVIAGIGRRSRWPRGSAREVLAEDSGQVLGGHISFAAGGAQALLLALDVESRLHESADVADGVVVVLELGAQRAQLVESQPGRIGGR